MMGRRSAALLCVLLTHALFILALRMHRPEAGRDASEFSSEPITLYLPALPPEEIPAPQAAPTAGPVTPRRAPATPAAAAPAAPLAGGAITPPARVDWPLEGRHAAESEVAKATSSSQ